MASLSASSIYDRISRLAIGTKWLSENKNPALRSFAPRAQFVDRNQDSMIAGASEMRLLSKALADEGDGAEAIVHAIQTKDGDIGLAYPWYEPVVAPSGPLARIGRATIEGDIYDQGHGLATVGMGPWVGSESEYNTKFMQPGQKQPKKQAEYQASVLKSLEKPGVKLTPPKTTDCITWVRRSLMAAYKGAAAEAKAAGNTAESQRLLRRWAAVDGALIKDQGSGVRWFEQLRQDGWTSVYWNADMEYPDETTAAAFNIHKVHADEVKKHGTYYGLKIDQQVVNFRPTTNPEVLKGATPTPRDASGLAKLAGQAYGVGVAKGGLHSYVLNDGEITEFHWNYEPGERLESGMQSRPLMEFMWDSGVILLPPKSWPKPAPPT